MQGGFLLFGVVKVEVAVFMKLLAFLCAFSRLSVVGVKLGVQLNILRLLVSADEVCVLLHSVSFLITHSATGSALNAALSLHSLCNLQEAGDVSACHVVAGHAVLLGSLVAALEDGYHDVVELLVNFLEGPAISDGVLAHLKTGGS